MPFSRFSVVCSVMLCLPTLGLLAQRNQHPVAFDQALTEAALDLLEPLDAGYRAFEPLDNDYLNCQFALYSRREKLELRYYVLPWNEQDVLSTTPNVASFRVLTTIASNADDAVISALQLDKETLQTEFNADWGMAYYFAPKPAFSAAPRAKMLAVSKEGLGTAFVFFLFDDPNNPALDARQQAVRFKDGPTELQK